LVKRDLRRTRPATVSGQVVDAAGHPIAGREVCAGVAVAEVARHDPTSTAQPDGTFTSRSVRSGEQHIRVAPFGLDTSEAPEGIIRTMTPAIGEAKTGVELTAAPGR
jgi:hypothetical protein